MFHIDMGDLFSSPANWFLLLIGCVAVYAFVNWLGIVLFILIVFAFIKWKWG